MIRVAVVDDQTDTQACIKEYLERYGRENDKSFSITFFSNGVDFVSDYTPRFDFVFMDIAMPMLNGLETSKILRKMDKNVRLIFVTNLEKYAVHGYDVGAVGFIVKPLNYATFLVKMNRFMTDLNEEEPFLLVPLKSSIMRVNLSDIYYITVLGRYVLLHTKDGELELHKSMKLLEKELEKKNFVRCDNSAMVNLKYVTAVSEQGALVHGENVPCSRSRKKALLDAFTLYLR